MWECERDAARSRPECSPSWLSCWWRTAWTSWVWRCRRLKAGCSPSCYRHWRCTWNTQHTHIIRPVIYRCVCVCVFLSETLTSRSSASVWWSVWSPGCWGCSRGRCRGQRSLVGTWAHRQTYSQFSCCFLSLLSVNHYVLIPHVHMW